MQNIENLLVNKDYVLVTDQDLPSTSKSPLAISTKHEKYIECGEAITGELHFFRPADKEHTHITNVSLIKKEDILYTLPKEQ